MKQRGGKKIYKSPFFSVIIPTYNCARFLKRALSSVISQTYQDFEIIVVDNSSTDDTQNVLESFADQKLNVITVNNNGIIAYSRNRGIENARGEWIALLDSDDIWKPEKLEKVREAINHNPEVILVCHDEWHVDNGQIKKRLKYGPSTDLYERLLFKGNCLSTSAVSLRRDIALETGGFSEREHFITVEDYEYWIRLSQIGDFFFIDDVLGEWHTHGENYSSTAKFHADALIAVMKHHFDLLLRKFPNKQKQVKHGYSKAWTDAGRILQKGRMFSKANKYVIKAICLNPFQWKAWAVLLLSCLRISNK